MSRNGGNFMEKKADRRVKRTCDALQQSLLSLMQHRPLEQITVRELCQKADINRGTFYLHYHDVYELYDAVQMEIMDELSRTVETHCSQVQENEDPAPYIILDIFEYFTQNYQACVAIFQQDRSNVFLRRIRNILRPRLIHRFIRDYRADEAAADYYYNYLVNGCIGIMQHWLLSGRKQSPQTLARMTMAFVDDGARAFLTLSMEDQEGN